MSLKLVIFLLFLGLLAPALVFSEEKPGPPRKKMIVIFVGATSLEDFISEHTPNLQSLINRGALGIMNARTAGSYSPENAYATLSAKDRAVGSQRAGQIFAANESLEKGRAGQVFSVRTGVIPPADSLVVLDFPYLLQANKRNWQDTGIGALGEYLNQHGKQVTVIGNADTDEVGREVGLVAMNAKGYIPAGKVGNSLVRNNPHSIYGIQTDFEQILTTLLDYLPESDGIFIETGDTSRLEKGSALVLPRQKEKLKKAALVDVDNFLNQLLPHISFQDTLLFIVSPYPSRESISRGDTLPPVLAVGAGIKAGLLYSSSTRQQGILTIFDLQSTFLNHLGLDNPPGFQGRPLSSWAHPDPVGFLQKTNNQIIKVNADRSLILKGFVVLQIILIFSALAVILIRPKSAQAYHGLNLLITGITIIPLALLFLPLFNFHGPFQVALYLLLTSLIGGLFVFNQHLPSPRLPGILALLTAIAILVDIINHSALMRASILGFSPVGGARYYGIGNEYLGILLGASVTGTTIIMEWAKKRWLYLPVLLFFLAWTFFSAAPWFGSNFGGGISLSVTYLLLVLLLSKVKWSRRRILLTALAGAALFVLALGIIDYFTPFTSQSHIGQLVTSISQHGPGVVIPVITRKLRMNLVLLEYTIWTKALLSFILVLIVIFHRPTGKIRELAEGYPLFFKGFWSSMIGSIVVLLVNDSGIVAAATSLLYPVMALLTIILKNLTATVST